MDNISPSLDLRITDGHARRLQKNRLLAAVALLALLSTFFFWFHEQRAKRYHLRITAGDLANHRQELAEQLCEEAARHQLHLELVPTRGSVDALDLVRHGKIDLALIGGEVGQGEPEVRQVATLSPEPLHLFVRAELAGQGVQGLRGQRVNLGAQESGTRHIAGKVLRFAGLEPGSDFTDLAYAFEELAHLPPEQMPDAFFVQSPLPWQLGYQFAHKHGYRLVALPVGNALALRDAEIVDQTIPAYTYGMTPPVPDGDLHTVATSMMVIANENVATGAVVRLLEVLYDSDFARRATLKEHDPRGVLRVREFLPHPGVYRYLRRSEPLINGQVIDSLENLRSFLFSAAIFLFVVWQWYRQRQMLGFEGFFDQVSELEVEALQLQRDEKANQVELQRLRERLTTIKADVIERHASGQLKSDEQLTAFLTHVADVRRSFDCLERQLGPTAHESAAENRTEVAPDAVATN